MPVQRLWPASVRLVLWLALESAVLAWVIVHARNDFMPKLARPAYLLEFMSFGTAAILSAWCALKSALPGRVVRPVEAFLCLVLVLAGTTIVAVSQQPNFNGQLGAFVKLGIPCVCLTGLLAALPWLVLWWTVKRGAPLQGAISGLWIGAAAFFSAFAMMRIVCPIDDPLHLITWHLLPALVATALSASAGRIWLGLRLRLLPRHRAA